MRKILVEVGFYWPCIMQRHNDSFASGIYWKMARLIERSTRSTLFLILWRLWRNPRNYAFLFQDKYLSSCYNIVGLSIPYAHQLNIHVCEEMRRMIIMLKFNNFSLCHKSKKVINFIFIWNFRQDTTAMCLSLSL